MSGKKRHRLFRVFFEQWGAATLSGMDRRLWLLSRNRLGFAGRGIPVLYLFYPHLFVCLGLFAGGLGIPVIRLLGGHVHVAEGVPSLALCFMAAFATPFVYLMVPTFLGRRAAVLDRSRRTVAEVRGLQIPFLPLIPVWRKRYPFDAFDSALLESNGSTYLVSMRRPKGKPVRIVTAVRFVTARRLAEEIVRFTGLPMADATGGTVDLRPAALVDEPLYKRLQRQGLPPEVAKPESPKAEATQAPDGRRVRLDAPRFPYGRLVLGAAGLLAVAAILYAVLPENVPRPNISLPSEKPSPDWSEPSLWPWRFKWLLWALGSAAMWLAFLTGGGMALVLLVVAGNWPRGYDMRVSAGGIAGEVRRPWGTKRIRIDRERLEELRLVPQGATAGLQAITDDSVTMVLCGVDPAEAAWLRRFLMEGLP